MSSSVSPDLRPPKHPMASKTIVGAVLGILGVIASIIVDAAPALEAQFPQAMWLSRTVAAAGFVLAIVGRYRADRPIGPLRPVFLLAVLLLAGCANPPPVTTVDQNIDGQQTGNTAMNTTTLMTPETTYTDSSTGGLTTVDQDSTGMNVASHGPVTASSLDLAENRMFGYSGGDFSVERIVIDEREDGRTITVEGVSSTASEVVRAFNEGYDRLVTVWSQFSQDQRDQAIEQLRTQGALGEAILDVLATIPVR